MSETQERATRGGDRDPRRRLAGTEPPSRHSRLGGVWILLVLGAAVLVLLLVFILQNGQHVEVHLYGGHWDAPLGVALLFAAALGVLLVVVPGGGRIIQLRRATLRLHRERELLAGRLDDMAGGTWPHETDVPDATAPATAPGGAPEPGTRVPDSPAPGAQTPDADDADLDTPTRGAQAAGTRAGGAQSVADAGESTIDADAPASVTQIPAAREGRRAPEAATDPTTGSGIGAGSEPGSKPATTTERPGRRWRSGRSRG